MDDRPQPDVLLVCVGPSPASEKLVRTTHRIADGMHARWYAVHVEMTGSPPLAAVDRDRVEAHIALAESLGGEALRLSGASVASAVLAFAREHGVTRIVAGKPTHSRWRDRIRGSLLDALIRGSGDLDILVIAPAQEPGARRTAEPPHAPWPGYVRAAAAVTAATAISVLARGRLALADDVMMYLFAIMLAALGGRGPGLFAALLSVAAYDFFCVPPHYTLAVAGVDQLMTFAVMLSVGTALGTVVARLRHAGEASRQRERRTASLLAFTAETAAAHDVADVAAAVVRHVEDALAAPAVVLVPAADGTLAALAGLQPLADNEMAVARWAHEHRRPAGRGTDMQPGARLLAVPLWVEEASAGVVAVQIERARRRIDLEARHLLEAIARQAGIAIARLGLASEARETALRMQTEELRSSLLSTVSHDLRTPLAIITGTASELRDHAEPERRDALDTIVDEARRLTKILENLLSITRVESGAAIKRDWVPVEEIVGAALARSEATLAGRDVAIHVDPELGLHVDPVLTEQLLINLIENAGKHTPAATPIEIRAARDGSGIALDISDRGPGLPPGPADQVFAKFFRGPDTRSAGAGLGLAVCRGIALAHGGHIEALRREGGGATFRVWLPSADAPEPPPEDA